MLELFIGKLGGIFGRLKAKNATVLAGLIVEIVIEVSYTGDGFRGA